jgi:hypothetical protein
LFCFLDVISPGTVVKAIADCRPNHQKIYYFHEDSFIPHVIDNTPKEGVYVGV